MTFRLGLTGSIGMGKSTAGRMFVDLGYPLWDADAAVHRLYAQGGAAVRPVGEAFPGAVSEGAIDRERLKSLLANDSKGLQKLERIVHPLVAADREEFVDAARHRGDQIVVLDIPLLFETGADAQMDGVAVVSTSAQLQRERVMAREGMTEQTFAMILSRQMPDDQKRARADWIIPSDNMQVARDAVRKICDEILERQDA
ncbi:dephospho-CoA kinase [Paracoccus aurantiacus]|uniref:Dephospho-CoA kinase n=1 Tax=Paracoccus aurantiacus TaxID=2599412 RepID=A0A5C6S0K4_9RHOB|nr:dephospho-CoA kinase [Paracoccus aurantiacus]TXB67795.1 dephospho-CoA kinase [Paracoccus aurantiacus]